MASDWNAVENWPAGMPKVTTNICKAENQPGHRPFNTYQLPKWVKHPDFQKPAMYLQPEDYMGSRHKHNKYGWNVAHIGAQCASAEGQGMKMLEKATPEEINGRDALEGWTPLHWAVLSDNPKAVIWLLKHDADPAIEDCGGRKAEDLVDQHWGHFNKRYWEFIGPKKEGPEPGKLYPRRIKQMKEAFKNKYDKNDFDLEGYNRLEV